MILSPPDVPLANPILITTNQLSNAEVVNGTEATELVRHGGTTYLVFFLLPDCLSL